MDRFLLNDNLWEDAALLMQQLEWSDDFFCNDFFFFFCDLVKCWDNTLNRCGDGSIYRNRSDGLNSQYVSNGLSQVLQEIIMLETTLCAPVLDDLTLMLVFLVHLFRLTFWVQKLAEVKVEARI